MVTGGPIWLLKSPRPRETPVEALDLPEDDFSFAEYVAPEASTPRRLDPMAGGCLAQF